MQNLRTSYVGTPSGQCTSKSAYNVFVQNQQLPSSSARRTITDTEKQILLQLWKNSNMPPRVKTFSWRLIRRALATGLRASRFSNHIKKECVAACHTLERLLFPSPCYSPERGEKGVLSSSSLRRRPICRSPPSPAAVAVAGEWGDPGSVP